MIDRSHALRFIVVGFAVATGACAAEVTPEAEDSPEVASLDEAILGGTMSLGDVNRAAIGSIRRTSAPNDVRCTATLISSRVILTAAHCFDYNPRLSGFGNFPNPGDKPDYGDHVSGVTFNIDGKTPINVTRAAILAIAIGDRDIAVARLASDVPSSWATPLEVATSSPSNGSQVTAWGYGSIANVHAAETFLCTGMPQSGLTCPDGGRCVPFADQNLKPGGMCMATVQDGSRVGQCTAVSGGNPNCPGAPDQICVPAHNGFATGCWLKAQPLKLNGVPVKSTRTATWDAAHNSIVEHRGTPGDSGGPVLNSAGQIVGVFSAACGTCTSADPTVTQDALGNVVAHRGFVGRLNAAYGNKVLCTTCEQIAIETNVSPFHFVQALNGGGSSVNTNPTSVAGGHEKFRMVPLGTVQGFNVIYGFQAEDTGYWLMAEDGGSNTCSVVANSTFSGPWEAFYVNNLPNNGFNLTTFEPRFVDGAFRQFLVTAEETTSTPRPVKCNRRTAGAWETLVKLTILTGLPD